MDSPLKPAQVRTVMVSSIRASPYQARRSFRDETLKALAASMKHEGLIQPITIRRLIKTQETGSRKPELNDAPSALPLINVPQYELVSGERRLRAAKLLGWETIDARVIDVISEGEAAAKGLVENLQREDLDPIEEAEGFARLNRVDPIYWRQDKIAEVVGKDRTYVSRSLALLSLPEIIQADMRRGLLSRNHGIELCRLPTAEMRLQIAEEIRGRMNVQETRRRVNQLLAPAPPQSSSPIPTVVPASHKPEDPLGPIWGDFLKNPWLGQPGSCQVSYLGKNRWNVEISFPDMSPSPLPLSADARVEIARSLGDRLARIGRSLRVVPRDSFSNAENGSPEAPPTLPQE